MNDEQPDQNTIDRIERMQKRSQQNTDSDEPRKTVSSLNDCDHSWNKNPADIVNETEEYNKRLSNGVYDHPPSLTDAHSRQGRVVPHHFITDSLFERLSILHEQIEQKPKDVDLRFQRIAVYIGLDRWEAVIHESGEIARIDPSQSSVAWALRGWALGNLGEFDKALTDIAQSLTLNPNDAATYAVRADILSELADWQGAIADHSKIIEIDPMIPDAWIGRARAHYRLRKFAEAEADLLRAEPLFESDWIKASARAYVYERGVFSDEPTDEDYYGHIYENDDNDWDCHIDDLGNDTEDDGSILLSGVNFNDDDMIVIPF